MELSEFPITAGRVVFGKDTITSTVVCSMVWFEINSLELFSSSL